MSDLARQVVSGFGFRWVHAEVARTYPNDITRCRINIKGQQAGAEIADPRDIYREGDWVIAVGPNPETREWLIVGYSRSMQPGAWYTGGIADAPPDLSIGNGPMAGDRRPFGNDSMWRNLGAYAGPDTFRGNHVALRPLPGNDRALNQTIRVYAGYTVVPHPGYGTFSVPGDRLQIQDDVGTILKPQAYCLTQDMVFADPPYTIKAGTMVNTRPLGPNVPLEAIHGGVCDPLQVDKTQIDLGPVIDASVGFRINLKFTIDGAANAELFYSKFQVFLSDRFMQIGRFNGNYAIGIGRQILVGLGGYPSGGIGADMTASDDAQAADWFHITPWPAGGVVDIYDREKVKIGSNVTNFQELEAIYTPGGIDPVWGPVSFLTVSDGIDSDGGRLWKTYWLDGELYNGFAAGLYSQVGNHKGKVFGPVIVNDTIYPLEAQRPPRALKMYTGEIGWHQQLLPGDIDPETGAEVVGDPGDTLSDGLYVQISPERIMWLPGVTALVGNDGLMSPVDMDKFGQPIYPLHSQIRDSDVGDDHPQYHTDARALAWLATRTADDLAPGAAGSYVSLEDREILDQLADSDGSIGAGGTLPVDLSAQVDGTATAFTTPVAFKRGSLRVTLNSTPLRNGVDFAERPDGEGFVIGLRTPTNASPADVLTVGYRTD